MAGAKPRRRPQWKWSNNKDIFGYPVELLQSSLGVFNVLKYMTGIDSAKLFALEHAQILNITTDEIGDCPRDYIQVDIA